MPTRRTFLNTLVSRSCQLAAAGTLLPVLASHSSESSCYGFGPQDEMGKAFEAEFPTMGSKMNLRWFDPKNAATAKNVVDKATEVADFWDDTLSDYQQESEAMQVAALAQKGNWAPVSEHLWEMLDECDRWNKMSFGAFDASLGAITVLRRKKTPATEAELAEACENAGWKNVELDYEKRLVRFKKPKLRFDFGAIGKGFVVDKIANALQRLGVRSCSINSSGNMFCGNPPFANDGTATKGWPVAVDSLQSSDTEICRLRLIKSGVATSGNAYQNFPDTSASANGASRELVSHILDPKTMRGLPGRHSATAVADTAADADAAATVCCILAHRESNNQWLDTILSRIPLRVMIQFQATADASVRFITAGNFFELAN